MVERSVATSEGQALYARRWHMMRALLAQMMRPQQADRGTEVRAALGFFESVRAFVHHARGGLLVAGYVSTGAGVAKDLEGGADEPNGDGSDDENSADEGFLGDGDGEGDGSGDEGNETSALHPRGLNSAHVQGYFLKSLCGPATTYAAVRNSAPAELQDLDAWGRMLELQDAIVGASPAAIIVIAADRLTRKPKYLRRLVQRGRASGRRQVLVICAFIGASLFHKLTRQYADDRAMAKRLTDGLPIEATQALVPLTAFYRRLWATEGVRRRVPTALLPHVLSPSEPLFYEDLKLHEAFLSTHSEYGPSWRRLPLTLAHPPTHPPKPARAGQGAYLRLNDRASPQATSTSVSNPKRCCRASRATHAVLACTCATPRRRLSSRATLRLLGRRCASRTRRRQGVGRGMKRSSSADAGRAATAAHACARHACVG